MRRKEGGEEGCEDDELVQGCKQALPAAASLAKRTYLPRKTDFKHFAIGAFLQ